MLYKCCINNNHDSVELNGLFQPHIEQAATEEDAGGAVVTETGREDGGTREEATAGQKGLTCIKNVYYY